MTQPQLSRIGKYEVDSVVGEGAMGVVYCAVDSMLTRRVAIKVMSDAIAQDTHLRERFLREAQAAGSLQHPNVVTVYDFGEVDGHLYIAMEYVEGEDLEDILRSKIPLPLDAKLELIIGVLQGLAFAHKRGVIHRDIKPANIRVDQEGKARIMDFGVAHLASSDMTRTGTMLGTPSYMAPEQIVGGPVSPETDIFSVGAVLYELLTNVRPFRGDTLQTLMYQILSTTPPPVHQVASDLPADLNRIVMRALQKEPKDRYSRALDMANDLAMVKAPRSHDGTVTSLSLRATIDSALADRNAGARRTARRRQLLTIGGGAVAAALLFGAAYTFVKWNSAPSTSDSTHLVASSAAGTISDSASAANNRSTPAGSSAPSAGQTPPASPGATGVSAPPTSLTANDAKPSTPTTPRLTESPKPAGPTPQEIELTRRVQRASLDKRERAVAAGATAEQLREGDGFNASGQRALDRGRTIEAADAFNRASAAWLAAERAAKEDAASREAAAAAARLPAPTGAPATPPAPRPAEPQVLIPPPATVTSSSSTSLAPVTPPRPPANPAPEVNSVIASYARAIESRDIAELRRVYPSITAAQRTAFEDFFRSTRSLSAVLAVSDLQVDGTNAEARVTGSYQFVTTAGATQRQPASFRATLRYEGGAWKLVAVR